MITRPLDLASRLRKAPRDFDALFYVNTGALALFFLVFGSRFVLSPGLETDFALPVSSNAAVAARSTEVVIAVQRRDMALVDGAVLNYYNLGIWLQGRALGQKDLRLLVQANAALSAADLAEIHGMAAEAGFAGVVIAVEGMVREGER